MKALFIGTPDFVALHVGLSFFGPKQIVGFLWFPFKTSKKEIPSKKDAHVWRLFVESFCEA